MLDLSSAIGDEKGALVSLRSKASLIVIYIFTAVILFMLIIKIKNKKPLMILPSSYPLILALLILVCSATLPQQTELTALSASGSEYILAVYEDESAVIDVSVGSLTGLRALSEQMHERGVTEIETLVLTHYHSRHLSAVTRFVAEEKVRRVLLPYPETEDDAWIMLQLSNTLADYGVSCEIIPDESFALIGEANVCFSPIRRLERSTHPLIAFSLTEGEEKLAYLSASAWECDGEYLDTLKEHLSGADVILFGSHGPVVKTQFELIDFCPTIHSSHSKMDEMFELGERFLQLKPEEKQVFYVWGHAYEFDIHNTWDRFEEFLRMMSGRDDILYVTNKEALL